MSNGNPFAAPQYDAIDRWIRAGATPAEVAWIEDVRAAEDPELIEAQDAQLPSVSDNDLRDVLETLRDEGFFADADVPQEPAEGDSGTDIQPEDSGAPEAATAPAEAEPGAVDAPEIDAVPTTDQIPPATE